MGTMSDLQVSFLTALPFCCAAVINVPRGAPFRQVSERRLHIAVCMSVGGLALLACAFIVQPVLELALLCVARRRNLGISRRVLDAHRRVPDGCGRGDRHRAHQHDRTVRRGLLGPWLVGVIKEPDRQLLGGAAQSCSAIAAFALLR